MINKVTVEGLKTWDLNITFTSPVAVVTGPSRSGKTCVLDAIRLGILGYVPSYGKRPTAIQSMLRPGATGRIRMSGSLGDQAVDLDAKVGKKGITETVPACGLDEIVLDPEVFISAGPTDKARILMERFAPSKEEHASLIRSLPNSLRSTVADLGIEAALGQLEKMATGLASEIRTASGFTAEVIAEERIWPDDLDEQWARNDALITRYREALQQQKAQRQRREEIEERIAALDMDVTIAAALEIDAATEEAMRAKEASIEELTEELQGAIVSLRLLNKARDIGKPCPTCGRLQGEAPTTEELDRIETACQNAVARAKEIEQQLVEAREAQAMLQQIDQGKAAASEIERLEKQLAEFVIEDEGTLRAAMENAVMTRERLLEMRDARSRWVARDELRQRSRKQVEMKEAELEKVKLARDKLKSIRASSVDDRLNMIAKTATDIAQAAGQEDVRFSVNGGELVLDVPTGPITWRAMCGFERMCLTVGTAAALAKDVKPIILLDEMSRMDDSTKRGFLSAMLALTATGKIEQFIGADTYVPMRLDGMETIEMEKL